MSGLSNTRTYEEKKRIRTQQVRKQKNILYAVSIAIVLLLIVTLCVKLSSNPNRAEASESGSYIYTSIEVEEGDSLWSIAEDNINNYTGTLSQYVEEIACVNQLSDDTIEAGSTLIIPIFQSQAR